MYQPKIRDDLISRLYHLAKARRIPMTRLINQLLDARLPELEAETAQVSELAVPGYTRARRRTGGRDGTTP